MKHRSILPALLSLLALTGAAAQTPAERRVDSIVRARDELFDYGRPDTLDEETIPADTLRHPHTWAPEFLPRFERRDLLGLRDRQFFVTYDRADGLFLGAGADLPRSVLEDQRLQAHLGLGYSFGSHYWQVAGGARRDFLDEDVPLRLGAEGHILTDTRDAWKMDLVENTLYAVIAGGDARDYFQRRGFSVSLEKFLLPRVSIAAEYRFDRYRSSQRTVAFSIFGPPQPFREVPSVFDGPLRTLAVTLLTDYISLRSWSQPQFGVALEVELGSGVREIDGGSTAADDYSVRSYVVDARLKSTLVPGAVFLAVRGRAGATTGSGAAPDGPPQRWFSLGGPGTLPGYRDNELVGNRMLLVNTDVLIQPIASGLGRNLRIIVSNDFGAASLAAIDDRDDPFALAPASITGWAYSPGLYIGSPAGHVRIGAAWRTDRMESPRFVLRLSETF